MFLKEEFAPYKMFLMVSGKTTDLIPMQNLQIFLMGKNEAFRTLFVLGVKIFIDGFFSVFG